MVTSAVAAAVACVEPTELPAVTTTRIVWPTSAARNTKLDAVAPETELQPEPELLQSSHT